MRGPARTLAVLSAFWLLAGCADLPRDPAGTTQRIKRTGTLRFGLVAGARLDRAAGTVLANLQDRTGARTELRVGDSEELFAALERGEIDLVYGRFAADSPWAERIHLADPPGMLGEPAQSEPVPRFATMLGENGLIMIIARSGE
ncbi:hypothetical protein [Tsuneonella sp. SYSU-LHT278]|uniref:hypothetical protein n=1 Tax=Tsuneonella sediminis TaxID=3416089 RepID=UPI003F7AF923